MREKKVKANKFGLKAWIVIWVAGFAGQLAWNIENSWFNTYVYAKIAPDPMIITWMVSCSAVVSTLSVFILGTISDRVGKRRIFIALGYILWGITTITFGCTEFIPTQYMSIISFMTFILVLADCIMSFFGSMGNDAGFNTWTTDISNEKNRGTLGAVIAIQPVIATILGSIIFGNIITGFSWLKVGTHTLDYFMMFVITGVVMIAIGIACFFLVEESPTLRPHKETSFWKSFIKPFNFKLLRENKLLIWVLLIFMTFFISFQVYFPYILNYFIYTCGLTTDNAGYVMAGGLVAAVPFTILAAKFLNRNRFIPVIVLAVIANLLGLIVLSISTHLACLIVGIFFVGVGYMCIYQSLMAWVKNLYPEDMRSQLEGVRMFFYILIPMIIGSVVGGLITDHLGTEIVIHYETGDVVGHTPNYILFIVAACLVVFTFIPIYFAYRRQKLDQQKIVKEVS